MKLTQEDSGGTVFLRPWALPLVVAAICIPVVGLMLVSVFTVEGSALGLAAGAVAVASLLVIAARVKPSGRVEVAPRKDQEHRVLVLATAEIGALEAEHVASEIEPVPDDVRLLVPIRSRRLDRWVSATDNARNEAQDVLARSAGALVATGLPVSGSVGDSDPAQALEDELRSYSADQVIVLSGEAVPHVLAVERRLDRPVTHLTARSETTV